MSEAIRLPSFRLDNRVAMVTGSGTGIGAGIASGFAEAGADLVLVGRTLGPLEATARRVESFGRKAIIIVCDLTDRTELRSQIASLSCLDILINNAGTSIPEPILVLPTLASIRWSILTSRPCSSPPKLPPAKCLITRIAGSEVARS